LDTWAYDPIRKSWHILNPAERPPALTAHATAYDVLTNKTVLYGGVLMTKDKEACLFRQTWTFDFTKNTWKRVSDGPPGRYGHRMVGIAKSGAIVLFGGGCVDAATKNNAKKLADTWLYDATTDLWKEMRPFVSPSPRHYFGMIYDEQADRVVVWGGAQKESPEASSVWAYDVAANAWTERKPVSGPKPLSYVAMTYDGRPNKTVVYGGNSQGTDEAMDETWISDYAINTWTQRIPKTNPGKLSRMPIVYVSDIGQTVLFGGQLGKRQFVYSDEIWFYDSSADAWENATVRRGKYPGAAQARSPAGAPRILARLSIVLVMNLIPLSRRTGNISSSAAIATATAISIGPTQRSSTN
jgi:hypothetical protein